MPPIQDFLDTVHYKLYYFYCYYYYCASRLQCFDAVGWRQEGHPACKKIWGDGVGGQWALVSSNGVAPSRMVGVSASVNLPLHHKVQKFSSSTG